MKELVLVFAILAIVAIVAIVYHANFKGEADKTGASLEVKQVDRPNGTQAAR